MLSGGAMRMIPSNLKSEKSFTRPDNATAYTANKVVGTNPATLIELESFGFKDQDFIVTSAYLRIDIASIPSGMAGFRLHLYTSAPTAIADGAAWNLPAADRDKYIGYIEFDTPLDFGDTLWAQKENLTRNGCLVGTSLYGQLETLAGYTPSNLAVKKVGVFGVTA